MGLKDYLAGFAVSGQGAEGGGGIIAGAGMRRPRVTKVTTKAVLSPAQTLGAHNPASLFTFPVTLWRDDYFLWKIETFNFNEAKN